MKNLLCNDNRMQARTPYEPIQSESSPRLYRHGEKAHLETSESLLAADGLVADHTTDSAPEDAGRSAHVEGTPPGVRVHAQAQEGLIFQLVPVEGACVIDKSRNVYKPKN